jgi:hypothetical protein
VARRPSSVDMRKNLDVFSEFPWVEPAGRRFNPPTGSSGASSPASSVLSRRYDFLPFVSSHYASQCGLPTPHARLASSRWSGFTGRAFDPQGSNERFQGAYSISSPFPKLAWRNRNDRSVGERPCARRYRRTNGTSLGATYYLDWSCENQASWLLGPGSRSSIDRPMFQGHPATNK